MVMRTRTQKGSNRVNSRWSWALAAVLVLSLAGLLVVAERPPAARAASCWQAEISEQWTDVALVGSVLRVSVEGKVGLPVTIRSMGAFETIGFTGTKPEYGPYVAEFAPLSKGIYFIAPQGLDTIFQVWLDGKSYTRVDFKPLACAATATATPSPLPPTARPTATRVAVATVPPAPSAPPPTPVPPSPPAAGWQSRIAQHLEHLEGSYYATIAVRVIGRPAGQEVEIRSGGWSTMCKTGTKPEIAPDACEFGALNAGTYQVMPTGLGAYSGITVGLGDFVLLEFYEVGGGQPQARWVGSVVENRSGHAPTEHSNSAIAVIVAGKPWHEVEIRYGGFAATAQTGTKPEYGPDACEFGGLRAGTYTLTPKDLGASIDVTVDGWGWAMVRFDPVAVPAPPASPAPTQVAAATATPGPAATPAGPHWQGWIVSNTSGERPGTGVSSVVVVRVLGLPGVPVQIATAGGFNATCLTGTKPEYGPDACEFGGLWPGIYYVQPEGADIRVEVQMDGLGIAFVNLQP